MDIKLAVLANGDDVALAWKPTIPIPNCYGFAIERRRNGGAVEHLKNRVSTTATNEPVNEPSRVSPFKRVSWTDHAVNAGDSVEYRVLAMLGSAPPFNEGPTSDWSKPVTLTHDCGDISVFFNRGIVLSQFVARIMKERGWTAADIKKNAKLVDGQLRRFLSGDLRVALVNMLEEAAVNLNCHVYAALFELTDEELIARLVDLGPRLHIVLANGAVKAKSQDENAEARKALRAAACDVSDRFCAPSFLGHNKFVVLTERNKPRRVWTGSGNWMPTGLCTQVNNGVLIESSEISQIYLDAWGRLRDAGSAKGSNLLDGNTVQPAPSAKLKDGSMVACRFTAVRGGIDLDELLEVIDSAKKSILFTMFMPGEQIFNAVSGKQDTLFVRGVVNTFPRPKTAAKPEDETDETEVTLMSGKEASKSDTTFKLKVVEPQSIRFPIANWAQEVTKQQFRASIGHSIVHSKVLVIDAMGKNPIVVTGSHNFSKTASSSNDENFVVIRGNSKLAQAYAVNCLAVYDHYRWRQYVAQSLAQKKKPWTHNTATPNWLENYLKSPGRKELLDFFGL
ncbi:phospholipase D-like domain-containing protein [soil metagenome]